MRLKESISFNKFKRVARNANAIAGVCYLTRKGEVIRTEEAYYFNDSIYCHVSTYDVTINGKSFAQPLYMRYTFEVGYSDEGFADAIAFRPFQALF